MSANKMDYDLFVIGAGSGGTRAARMAAATGAKVAIAEEYRYGGTCVIRGCVPKKLMVYASGFSEHFEDAAGFGWTVEGARFDWARFMEAKNAEIDRLEGVYKKLLAGSDVERFDQRATLEGPNAVRLADGRQISARHILIATGGAPFKPDVEGIEYAITSNEIFHLPALPRRALVVGGGYIAVEFAGILNGMGADVTQIYRRDLFLRGFDIDLRESLAAEMRKKGVDLRFNADIARIEKGENGLIAHMESGETLEVDVILYATGRKPNIGGLGLREAGIEVEKGAIKVDAYSKTSAPGVYAIGDVTDRVALTPVAIHEAMCLVDTIFKDTPTRPDHELIPTAVFSQPEMGAVGMTEDQARESHEIDIYRAKFRPMLHTLSGRDERMMMKIIVDKPSDRVLGVHILGHGAGEMSQCLGVAVKMGARKADFDATMAVHPTASEELVTMREPVT